MDTKQSHDELEGESPFPLNGGKSDGRCIRFRIMKSIQLSASETVLSAREYKSTTKPLYFSQLLPVQTAAMFLTGSRQTCAMTQPKANVTATGSTKQVQIVVQLINRAGDFCSVSLTSSLIKHQFGWTLEGSLIPQRIIRLLIERRIKVGTSL